MAAPAPAHVGVRGTEKEKKRTQKIADSLDLGGDLVPEGEEIAVGGEVTRHSKSVPLQQPNRAAGLFAERSTGTERTSSRRSKLNDPSRMPVGKRRSVG